MSNFDGTLLFGTKLDSSGVEGGIKGMTGKFPGLIKGAAIVGALGASAVIAGKKFWGAAKQTADYGDRVDKLSQKIGMSRKGFQQWDFVLSQNGMSIETLKGGMKKLNSTVDDVIQKGSTADTSFERLGISLDELKGKSREEIFNKTIEQLQGVKDQTEKAAIGADLFGKSAAEMAPLLNQSAKSTEELKQRAIDYGLVMSDEAVDASVKFTDSLDLMGRTMTGLKNKAMAQFLPGLSEIMDGFSGILTHQKGATKKLQDGFKNLGNAFAEVVPKVVKSLGSIAAGLLEAAPGIIEGLIKGIVKAIPAILKVIPKVITRLVKAIVNALPAIINAGVEIVLALVVGITKALPEIIKGFAEAMPVVVKALSDALPMIITAVVDSIPLIVDAIVDNLPLLIQCQIQIIIQLAAAIVKSMPHILLAVAKVLKAMLSAFGKAIVSFVKVGVKIVKALWKGISSVVKWIGKHVLDFAKKIPKWIWKGLKAMNPTGAKAIRSLWNGMKSSVSWLLRKVRGVGKSILKAFKKVVSGIRDIGANIIRGLWDGIADKVEWIKDKILGFVDNVKEWFKDFFGIHSPSKWAREAVGAMVGAGIGHGIEDSTQFVVEKADAFGKTVKAKLMTTVDTSGLSISASKMQAESFAGNQVIHNDNRVTITQPVKTPAETARAIRLQQTYGLAGAKV